MGHNWTWPNKNNIATTTRWSCYKYRKSSHGTILCLEIFVSKKAKLTMSESTDSLIEMQIFKTCTKHYTRTLCIHTYISIHSHDLTGSYWHKLVEQVTSIVTPWGDMKVLLLLSFHTYFTISWRKKSAVSYYLLYCAAKNIYKFCGYIFENI